MNQSIKLIETKKIEVNGKPVEERTQEMSISKNRKGKIKKRVKTSIAYFLPKDENGMTIFDFWNNIGYWREKYKSSKLFEDLINKNQ